MTWQQLVRADIRNALSILADTLYQYEQTTVGTISNNSIGHVGTELVSCYDDPDAHNVSVLTQRIRKFLKEHAGE